MAQETAAEAGHAVGHRHPPAYVYALGRIEPRFPALGVEKEFAQVVGRADGSGLTDRQLMRDLLSERQNRYLARQLCWVFLVQGMETYLLVPRDSADLDLLVEAMRPVSDPNDVDVVIGVRRGIAPPHMCNGLTIPVVVFDQIYSFDRYSLVQAMPRPVEFTAEQDEQWQATATALMDRVMQVADNAGDTAEHRALNYLCTRYPAVFERVAAAEGGNASLSGVEARRSSISGHREIVDVVFTFTHRRTDVDEHWLMRVDVTELFPFLVKKLSPFFAHEEERR